MTCPDLRLTCCLCRRQIARGPDIYALDAEWRRRFPQMEGILACYKCTIDRNQWDCGKHPNWHGSHPCLDGRSHIEDEGTQRAMVLLHPDCAVRQGAAHYLEWWATKHGNSGSDLARRVLAAVAQIAAQ